MTRHSLLAALLLASLLPLACSDDPDPTPQTPDASLDAQNDDLGEQSDIDATHTPDASTDADSGIDAGPRPLPGTPVDFDLGAFVADAPNPTGTVRLYQVTNASELLDGEGAAGGLGDFVLENDGARFLVQNDRRAMSPCPWGGNVIDAQYLGAPDTEDVLGEICLFLNADQTLKPERFEILHDGSEGYAVLAVTGRTELLDFLNLASMVAQVSPQLASQFRLRPDGLLPMTVTVYYVLRPGDDGVRVLTAMRNDGDSQLDIAVSHLIVSHGTGGYFNPLGSLGGFGYGDLGLANPNPDVLPFLMFQSEKSSFAYVPKPFDHLEADLPIAGGYLTIAGVAASVLGRTDIIQLLLTHPSRLPLLEGLHHLKAGDVSAAEHWIFAGDGALSTVLDTVYPLQGVDTGVLAGIVVDGEGLGVEGARVSATDAKNRTMNQALSGADGRYSMRAPVGDYTVSARLVGRPTLAPAAASVLNAQTTDVSAIVLELPATITVSVRTPDGQPTPARVSVLCEGPCPNKPTSREKEVNFHKLPADFALIEWIGVSGDHSFDLPAGTYRVVVSRGMEWSVWPYDALSAGGHLLTIAAGEAVSLEAEIARVLDTRGALSADFHVHAIASPDSSVANIDRILTFLVEGVDVVVSTDHDVITDFAPAVAAIGAQAEIVTVVGTEITTSDIGHFNGFPVVHDPDALRGGAFDWGNGAEPAVAPADLFAWVRAHDGEQVVQINHPNSSFLAQADVLRGLTYGDPVQMRVQATADPDTGETGMWSDDFTAMELLNGHSTERFWGVGRWWFTLLGRGMHVTATAVTDTHNLYGSTMGGVPRTFVFVPEAHDTATSFDSPSFIAAINQGRAIGTNGPFFRLLATNSTEQTALIGDTLATNGEPVTVDVHIEVPEWMKVDRLDLFMNADGVVTAPGAYDASPVTPTQSFSIALGPDDLVEVATGTSVHRRYEKVVTVTLDTAVDAYAVFVLQGAQGPTMFPVLPSRGVRPFAFSNPIYLDADGGGYNNPHLAALAQTPAPLIAKLRAAPTDASVDRELTPREIRQVMHSLQCGGH
ncbi:MAG: CehA/McbA family metallohydrolase [Bradymonadaceae bacterium]|nr:CehA/McbA family metallohydrolase [Lujinxingiaceae bacterium]